MIDKDKLELARHRLGSAEEKLLSAKLLLEAGQLKDSIGRSYYTMFSAIRALLACDGVDYSKHAGVIAYFQKEYIRNGIFGKQYSKYIQMAFQVRNNSDYDDFYIATKESAEEQYARAKELLQVIQEYLSTEKKLKNP